MSPLKYVLDLIDQVNKELIMKEYVQESVRTIIDQPYNIADSYYEYFLNIIKDIKMDLNSKELVAAYLGIVYFDNEDFVVRYSGDVDPRRMLVEISLDIYRSLAENKSDLLHLVLAMNKLSIPEQFMKEMILSNKSNQLVKSLRILHRDSFAEPLKTK